MSVPGQQLRVVVVADDDQRGHVITSALHEQGFVLAGLYSGTGALLAKVSNCRFDALVLDLERVRTQTLRDLEVLQSVHAVAVVIFAELGDTEITERVIQAGASGYVVNGFMPERLQHILLVAMARFREMEQLREERDQARMELADRELLQRAVGILMSTAGTNEEMAFQALRKTAMSRREKLADVARGVIRQHEKKVNARGRRPA